MNLNKIIYKNTVVNEIKILRSSHRDKNNNEYVVAECPICGNKEWIVQLNNIKSGHSKSCGCSKTQRMRNIGLANRKDNPIYYPRNCTYALLFLHNVDDYIIVDVDDVPIIKKYTWSGRVRDGKNNKIDAYTKINDKTVYLTDYLLETETKKGFQVDHISGETRDNRKCNTRNATREQNSLNKERAKDVEMCINEDNGKYIVRFSNCVKDKIYDSLEEAELSLKEYQRFTYQYSQEMASDNETNQFAIERYEFIGGTFEKIANLKEKHICKIILTNIIRDEANGILTYDDFMFELFKLEKFYKENFCDKKDDCYESAQN